MIQKDIELLKTCVDGGITLEEKSENLREYNTLVDNGYLERKTSDIELERDEAQRFTALNIKIYPKYRYTFSLSKKGIELLEYEERINNQISLQKEANSIAEKANKKSDFSNIISLLAFLVAIVAVVVAVVF